MSILPPNIASTSAAELFYTSSPTPLLYVSNRNLTLDPANIGDGDTILVLSTTPAPDPVGFVKTGLAQIRAIASPGDEDQYLLATRLAGGGVEVYECVSAEHDWLKELKGAASLNDTRVANPSAFVFV